MPSSDPSNIQLVLKTAMMLKPKSILDVGPGCGKYGLLFREYLDGHRQGRAFHDKTTHKIRIDCCEAFAPYITEAHKFIYDNCYKCLIEDLWRHADQTKYDLIFLGDVIEHFPKIIALELLQHLKNRWLVPQGHILISTPNFESNLNKPMPFNNELERHHCRFTAGDFKNVPNFVVDFVHEKRLVTVLLRSK